MDQDSFNEQVDDFRSRIDELYRAYLESPTPGGELFDRVFEEFSSVVEELQVTNEELKTSNDQVIESQQAAERAGRRYQELFELAPDGYLVTDENGVILEANQAALSLLNPTHLNIVGKPLLLYITLEDHGDFLDLLGIAVREHKTHSWETRIFGKDGSSTPVGMTVRYDPDGASETSLLRWLIRDIRPQKQLESELLAGKAALEVRVQERTAELGELAKFPGQNPNPILRVDRHGKILYANAASRVILADWSRETGQQVPAAWLKRVAEVMRTGERLSLDVAVGEQWFSFQVIPIPGAAYVNLYGREITDRKQVELEREQLYTQNRRQSTLLDAIFAADPSGLAVLVGPELRFAYVNPAYRYITPDPTLDPVGLPYNQVWLERSRYSNRDRFLKVVQTGQPFQVEGIKHHFRDGTARVFSLQARRIEWEDQHACLLILWDTTEAKQAEQALRNTQERMHMALANSSISVYTLDNDLRYTWYYSPRAGYTSEQILGRRDDDLVPTVEMADILAWKRQVMESGVGARREVHYRLGDQTVYLDVAVEPIKDPGGNVIGLLGTSMDITQRKRDEEAVSRSERRISTIFASITDYCYTLDPEWRFTTVNEPALAYFQKTREEILGKVFWEVFPQGLGTSIEQNYRQAVQEQKFVHYETLSPISGQWVEVHAYPSAEGLFVIFRDVTSRRKMEENLQASEMKFRELADSITDNFIAYDKNLRCIYRNKSAALSTLPPDDQAIGKTFQELFPDMIGSKLHQAYLQVLETHQSQTVQTQWVRPQDDFVSYYDVNIYPTREGIAVFSKDITERKQAERRAAEEHEWFRTTLASIGDAVITTDREGAVTFLNPVAERLTGWGSAEAVGLPLKTVFPIMHEHTHQPAESPVDRVLREGAVVGLANHTALIARDGRVIPIADSAAPIRNLEGETLGVVMVFHDVTDQRRDEDDLRQLNRTLQAVSDSSQAMMRAEDEPEYLAEVCRIITQDCGHAMVWIGFAELDEKKSIRPAASAGFEQGYLETLNLTWADTERGRGPTGTAIRTGQVSLCRNMLTDPAFEPWRAQALKRGYASSIVLPLTVEGPGGTAGKALGALSIYSREPDPFTENEIRLLSELASDLAYGITAIRVREAKAQVDAALRDSEQRLNLATEGTGMATWDVDLQTGQAVWSKRFYEILGYPPADDGNAAMEMWRKRIVPEDLDRVISSLELAERQHSPFYSEHRITRADNKEFAWLRMFGRFEYDDTGRAVRLLGVLFDNSAFKEISRFIEAGARASARPGLIKSEEDLRHSGIEVVGDVPWGTHFCQFYATSQDLVDTLVPYFRTGLLANEFCMWVTSAPLQVEQAAAALRAAMPELDDCLARGQIEILDYSQWYTRDGKFEADTVLQGWSDKLAAARQRGFEGLRLSGNTFWLEQATWDDFTRYEEKVNEVIGGQRMIALCTYSLEMCGVREVLDVVANHQFALIQTAGRWEIIESAKHREMEHALRESEERYRGLFDGMTEGFALHEIVCDEQGTPVDYRFLEINLAFERLTGLKRENLLGKLQSEVEGLRDEDPKWVEMYGKVALTGEAVHFENYSPALKMHYDVYAYRPAPDQFAVIFTNITERKQAEEALRGSEERFRLVLDNSQIAMYTTDRDLRCTWAYRTLGGVSVEEVLGKRDDEFRPPEDVVELMAFERSVLKAGKTGRKEICVPAAGRPRYYDITAAPICGQRGEAVGLTVTGLDVTDRVYMEEQSRQAAAQIEVQQRLLGQREQERQQIARDLHDGPVQELTGVNFELQALLAEDCPPQIAEQIQAAGAAVRGQIAELRGYASELRPPSLAKFGLGKAIRSHLAAYQDKHPGLKLNFEETQSGGLIPEEQRLALYRIYQEALTNIAKHAQATQVTVRLTKTPTRAVLKIRDNGVGFEVPQDWLALARQGHLGLVGLRERAEAVGGRVEIISRPGKGTVLKIKVPLDPVEDPPQAD